VAAASQRRWRAAPKTAYLLALGFDLLPPELVGAAVGHQQTMLSGLQEVFSNQSAPDKVLQAMDADYKAGS
jgi:hypothetical protein